MCVPTHILGFDLLNYTSLNNQPPPALHGCHGYLDVCTVTTHVRTCEALAGSVYGQLVYFTPGIGEQLLHIIGQMFEESGKVLMKWARGQRVAYVKYVCKPH